MIPCGANIEASSLSWSYHLSVATVQQLPPRAALLEHRAPSALYIRLVTAGPSPVLPSPQE